MHEIEPHVGGVAALRVPQEGIVDYAAVCAALVRKLEEHGARVVTNARVTRLLPKGAGWLAETTAGEDAYGDVAFPARMATITTYSDPSGVPGDRSGELPR